MDRQAITAGLEEEDALFLARLCDLADRCVRTGVPLFSGFCSPRIQTLAHTRIRGDFVLDSSGGYDGAERQMLRFSPQDSWEAGFPICALQAAAGDGAPLSHRDYLGAALGLGLAREAIGDIVIADGHAIYFCTPPACKLLEQELVQVGRSPVVCTAIEYLDELSIERKYETSTRTVPSMRLDCVVSAMTGKARGQSAALIEKGYVSVNYEVQTAVSKPVPADAVVAVRGYGKAQIAAGGISKKGRLHITIKKYV